MDNNIYRIEDGRDAILERSTEMRALVYSLGWTAYPRLFGSFVLRLFFMLMAWVFLTWVFKVRDDHFLTGAGLFAGLAFVIGWAFYEFAYLRTVKLYIDRTGIWVYQGILPWRKGGSGVPWDAVGEATYQQTFLSWIFKSYTVSVFHRFNGGAQISLGHVKRGDLAVQDINRLLTVRSLH